MQDFRFFAKHTSYFFTVKILSVRFLLTHPVQLLGATWLAVNIFYDYYHHSGIYITKNNKFLTILSVFKFFHHKSKGRLKNPNPSSKGKNYGKNCQFLSLCQEA